MPNLKDIKNRIASVENTKKITRAMKMVAAAKVKKAENSVKAGRPFADELIATFKKLLAAVSGYSSDGLKIKHPIENYPELLKKRETKMAGLLVITSNKGLAGAYNANIVRSVLKQIEAHKEQGIKTKLFIVGQKGISALKRKTAELDVEILQTYTQVANEVSAAGAECIAQDLAECFIAGTIDTIEIFTTKFKNMMSYSAQKWDLLPINLKKETAEASGLDPIMIFEPSEHSILQKLVPLYITNTIYQSLLEAQASELASRMTAMSAASNNAEEMIRILTIDYNKARQWAITQEILEVVSGADALKG
ncbi:MAG: ATP synthase F1 subunit gamma [Candidatus Gastranaerophilales bacterium]|nr:ATP synthase F1 subunit gamma [Candidatus Gastranaerophilales bacterium]